MPGYRRVEQVMGTAISLLIADELPVPALERLADDTFAWLREVDARFSTYREDSHVSAMNRGEPVHDPLVDTVVELCEQARERTGGYFDARLPGPSGGTWFDPFTFISNSGERILLSPGQTWIHIVPTDWVITSS